MKKYFIADTDEELVFGDVFPLSLKKKTKKGTHIFESEVVLGPNTVDFLLELGAIEVEDDEETEETEEWDDESPCALVEELTKAYKDLEGRVTDLEDELTKLRAKKEAKKK